MIASRFQPGAEIHGLDAFRKRISEVASWILRIMFPGARDYTCGYRCYRVGLLRWGQAHYGPEFLNQQGFSIMVDILLKLRRKASPHRGSAAHPALRPQAGRVQDEGHADRRHHPAPARPPLRGQPVRAVARETLA